MLASKQLIVALDFDNASSALALVDQLDPRLCAVKVGSELFTLLGIPFIRQLNARGFSVFLDLKFYDIPHTIARACSVAADAGVWMLTLHASGGVAMMQAAREAVASYGRTRPLLVGVTVLTSMHPHDLPTMGIHASLQEHVCKLAVLAQEGGLDGVVSSALETPLIKSICSEPFITVSPGIRRLNDAQDDQARIVTPEMALSAGSDYLVVGRPITRALNPAQATQAFLMAIDSFQRNNDPHN